MIPSDTPIAYVDESGIDRHMQRTRAWGPRGKRIVIARPGKRFKRLNIVAGQIGNKVIAPFLYDWTTNSQWFEVWFEWHFCPELPSGSVIVMDNASFHRKAPLEFIVAFYGHRILWLPPYSPDKNPIEHLWANLKKSLQNFSSNFSKIQDAILDYFKS